MKTLSGSSFFRLFDMLITIGNPGLKLDRWKIGDAQVERERHSFSGRTHCFAIDVYMLTHEGRKGWKLMIAKEHWWDGNHKHAIRTQAWARLIEGSRRDAMAWLRSKETDLQRGH